MVPSTMVLPGSPKCESQFFVTKLLRMPTPLATNLLIALGSAILLRALGFISMPILALTLPVALWTVIKITSSPKDKSLTERRKAPSPPREA